MSAPPVALSEAHQQSPTCSDWPTVPGKSLAKAQSAASQTSSAETGRLHGLAYLVQLAPGPATQPMVLTDSSVNIIGRDSRYCNLVFDDPQLSCRHADIRFEDGYFTLCDLQSTMGTFVNRRRIVHRRLQPFDRIRVGNTHLVFVPALALPLPHGPISSTLVNEAAMPGPDSPKNPFQLQAKMLWHLDRLAQWRLLGDTFPVLIEINLTNRCNQACRWCISSYSHLANPGLSAAERSARIDQLGRHPAMSGHPERLSGLDIDTLGSFLVDARAMGLRAVTWSGGGEPTVHPQFPLAMEAAARTGLEQGLMTNGTFRSSYVPIIGTHMRWVRISLDSLNPARYAFQKRSNGFDRVLANLAELVKYPVKVGVNMNLAAWNADEVLTLASWCRDAGVDYFQVRPVLDRPYDTPSDTDRNSDDHVDWDRVRSVLCVAETFSTDSFRVVISWDKFGDVGGDTSNRRRGYDRCVYHFFTCVLNADGDLCVCMYHLGDRRFTFGNIYNHSVAEIWRGEQRSQVIALCAGALDFSTCQACCKGHEINKLIHFIDHPDGSADVNFL